MVTEPARSGQTASEALPDSAPQGHGRVAKNASIYLIGQLISWLVTFASVSIIPRRLGETASGELTIAMTAISTVVALMQFGMDPLLTKEVGRDRQQAERLLRATIGLRLTLVLPSVLLSSALLAYMHPNRMIWTLGLIGFVGIPLTYLSTPLRAVLAGMEEARRVSTLDILSATAPLFAIPFLRYGPIALAIVNLMMLAVNIVLPSVWLTRHIRVTPLFHLPLWRTLGIGGMPFLINNYILTLYGFVSIFLLKSLAGVAAVGVYSQANRLFGTFLFVPTAIGAALLPSLARLATASPEEFRAWQSRVLSLLIILGLPVTASMLLLAHPLSLLLYGPNKFAGMPLVLQFYSVSIIPMYIVSTMYQFLVAQNRNAIWAAFLLTTVVIYGGISAVAIPFSVARWQNGAVGAVIATFVAETCSAAFAFLLLKNNPLNGETLSRILRALLATAGMMAAIQLSLKAFSFFPARFQTSTILLLPKVGGTALFGVVTFAALAWLLHVLTPEEQAKITGTLRRKLLRGR